MILSAISGGSNDNVTQSPISTGTADTAFFGTLRGFEVPLHCLEVATGLLRALRGFALDTSSAVEVLLFFKLQGGHQ